MHLCSKSCVFSDELRDQSFPVKGAVGHCIDQIRERRQSLQAPEAGQPDESIGGLTTTEVQLLGM